MVNFKLSNENNVKSQLVNMTQAWNKENSESLPGVQEVMIRFPLGTQIFLCSTLMSC